MPLWDLKRHVLVTATEQIDSVFVSERSRLTRGIGVATDMERTGDRGAHPAASEFDRERGGAGDGDAVQAGEHRQGRPLQIALLSDDAALAAMLVQSHVAGRIRIVGDNAGFAQEDLASSDAAIVDARSGWAAALSVACRVRALSPLGIVLLADPPSRDDRIRALSLGIDHVLPKPVDPAELAAILRNLARSFDHVRSSRRRGERHEAWGLDHVRWRLIAPEGQDVELSTSEYAVLSRLMASPGVQHVRADLSRLLPSRGGTAGHSRSLDVLISKIRAKIEQSTGRSFPLRSVRGVGYVFVGATRA